MCIADKYLGFHYFDLKLILCAYVYLALLGNKMVGIYLWFLLFLYAHNVASPMVMAQFASSFGGSQCYKHNQSRLISSAMFVSYNLPKETSIK